MRPVVALFSPLLVYIAGRRLSAVHLSHFYDDDDYYSTSTCQAEARAVKVLEREAPNVTEKSFVITSKESPSQQSEDWLAEVVSNVSPA